MSKIIEKIIEILKGCRLRLSSGRVVKLRIRKLTPRECFRLQDVDEENINKIQAAGISNSQQYKLAGNSITVAVLEAIFEQMFYPKWQSDQPMPQKANVKPKKASEDIMQLTLF